MPYRWARGRRAYAFFIDLHSSLFQRKSPACSMRFGLLGKPPALLGTSYPQIYSVDFGAFAVRSFFRQPLPEKIFLRIIFKHPNAASKKAIRIVVSLPKTFANKTFQQTPLESLRPECHAKLAGLVWPNCARFFWLELLSKKIFRPDNEPNASSRCRFCFVCCNHFSGMILVESSSLLFCCSFLANGQRSPLNADSALQKQRE